MRKHRFFLPQNLIVGNKYLLDEQISRQVVKILRLKIDELIFLFNNSGSEFTAKLHSISPKEVHVIITAENKSSTESSLKIHLGQVVSKGQKMDFTVQKAVELGVHCITPLYSERTVVKKIEHRNNNKIEHWQKISIAASCQCWRNSVPKIYNSMSLDDWLNEKTTNNKIILDPTSSNRIKSHVLTTKELRIVIGPEGGFSEPELQLAQQNGFQNVSLGPRVLRTETAGIAAIAILQTLFGDI